MMKQLTAALQALLDQSGVTCVRMGRAEAGTPLPRASWTAAAEDGHAGRVTVTVRALSDDTACLDALDKLLALVPAGGRTLRPETGALVWLWRESACWERDADDPRLCTGRAVFGFTGCAEGVTGDDDP